MEDIKGKGILYIGNPEDNNVLATTKGNIKFDDLPLNECYVIAKQDFKWCALLEKGVIKKGDKTKINFYAPHYRGSWLLLCGDCWYPFEPQDLMSYFDRL
jgi:hypothetical protein